MKKELNKLLIKGLSFEFNSVNNSYDWSHGSVTFGIDKDGKFDYFRIQKYQNDYNPDYDSIEHEIRDRIKDLEETLKLIKNVNDLVNKIN